MVSGGHESGTRVLRLEEENLHSRLRRAHFPDMAASYSNTYELYNGLNRSNACGMRTQQTHSSYTFCSTAPWIVDKLSRLSDNNPPRGLRRNHGRKIRPTRINRRQRWRHPIRRRPLPRTIRRHSRSSPPAPPPSRSLRRSFLRPHRPRALHHQIIAPARRCSTTRTARM